MNFFRKCLFFFCLFLNAEIPNDQALLLFGSNGYILYRVLDFANDHGFRYIKILSFEFRSFEHHLSGHSTEMINKNGHYFEINEEEASISFLCFNQKPEDSYFIDLEKYQSILEVVAEASSD